jgi:gas vesicle protein
MARNTSNNNSGMNNNTRTILTLLTGAVAGAVTALLLAPQSGAETRSAIRKTTSRLSGDLGSSLKTGVDKLVNLGRGGDDSETSDTLTDLTGEGLGADGYTGRRTSGSSMRGAGNPTGLGSNGTPATSTSRRGQGGIGDV